MRYTPPRDIAYGGEVVDAERLMLPSSALRQSGPQAVCAELFHFGPTYRCRNARMGNYARSAAPPRLPRFETIILGGRIEAEIAGLSCENAGVSIAA